jgi:hypothetical protein
MSDCLSLPLRQGSGGSLLALVETGFEDGFAAGMRAPVRFCRTADGAFG